MVNLIGIILALGALYWWLLGHWFARIIILVALAALFGGLGLAVGITSAPSTLGRINGTIGGGVGIAIAWFASGVPIYYRRYRARLGAPWI